MGKLLIQDYWLLVALQTLQIYSDSGVSEEILNLNYYYWNKVLKLPIDPKNPSFTYEDRLHQLVREYNTKDN